MSRANFITHNGKQILHLDFTNTKPVDSHKIIAECKEVIRRQPPKSLRTLTDFTGADLDNELSNALKDFAAHNKPYVQVGAVLGVTGLKKVIFNAVLTITGRNLRAFDSAEEAKDWLINQ